MLKRESRSLWVCVFASLWLFGVVSLFAEENSNTEVSDTGASVEESVDSTSTESSEKSAWMWPVEHIIQPFLNGLIYPIAQPVDYAFKNGVIEKTVELISFGEDYKIMVYPSFNFKPGSRTMVGMNYRHRSVFFNKDYLVLQGEYFANGDMGLTARYTKHSLFGTRFFGGFRYDIDLDRDNGFTIPESKESYL